MALNWQHVTVADYRKLRDARLLAHYGDAVARACGASVHRGEAARRPHQSRLGRQIPRAGDACAAGGSRLGLRVPDLTLSILDTNDALPLDGRAEPRCAPGSACCRRAATTRPSSTTPSPYQMPHNVVALGARYSIEELVDPLNAIAVWFSNGNAMLKAIRDGLVKRQLKAPEVRCWPHHFDMDSLIQLGGNRAVGSGFCPGDEFCDEPYFYISIYPEPYIPALPSCRRSGTGTPTSSSRRWRRRTRSSPRWTSRATSPASSTSRSTRRSKRSDRVGRPARSR